MFDKNFCFPLTFSKFLNNNNLFCQQKNGSRSSLDSHGEYHASSMGSSLDSDDIYNLQAEVNRLQEDFQKDIAYYKDINDQLHVKINSLKQQNREVL